MFLSPSSLRRALIGAALFACAHFATAQTTAGSAKNQPEPIRLAMIEAMSGPFSNAGDAVLRNVRFAIERVNAQGGVQTSAGKRTLELLVLDGKGQPEESLVMLKAALDRGVLSVLQGNSSAVAGVLADALDKHNAREPTRRALFLNYSAVDPALTNEKCTFWHFRFDAHTDMRLAALVAAIAGNKSLQKVYLLNQDYVFGQGLARSARAMLAALRPDIQIVGDELHPLGRVKDFSPYASKIKASGAQAVISGSWGNDLTLLVKAAKEVSLDADFYTFYGNGLGAPAAIGDAGVDRVVAVSEWHNNAAASGIDALYAAFRKRYPDAKDDYFNPRNVLAIEMLVRAIEQAGSADALAVGQQLSGLRFNALGFDATLRAADHQLIQPLMVYRMGKQGSPGIARDLEGSGYGFKTWVQLPASAMAQAHRCDMRIPNQP